MQKALEPAAIRQLARAMLNTGKLDMAQACEVQRVLGLCAGRSCSSCQYAAASGVSITRK